MFLTLSYLSILIAAQQDCDQTNYQPCLDLSVTYRETTCEPLATRNATYYNDCLCYNYANEALCYQQCPNNATVQNELRTTQIPKTENQCRAQGFNYLALPRPATWETYFVSIGGSAVATQRATSTVTSTPRAEATSNSANTMDYSWAYGLLGLFL